MLFRNFSFLRRAARRLSLSRASVACALLLPCAAPVVASAQCSGTPSYTATSTNSSPITLNDEADPNQGEMLSTPEEANAPNYPVSITVPATDAGTVTCIQVELNNINAPAGNDTQALYNTEILLVSPTGQQMVILGGPGLPSPSVSGINFLIGDGYSSMPIDTGSSSFPTTPTTQDYEPTSNILAYNFGSTMPGINSPGSDSIANASFPQTDKSATMNTTHSGVSGIFSGVQSNGAWSLYVADWIGDPVTIQNWTLKLWISQTQVSSTTAIATNVNPVAPGSSVTYTATVSSSMAVTSGTVSFYANGSTSPLNCSQGTAVAVNSSGQAQCTVTLSAGSTAQCTAFSTTSEGTGAQSLPAFPTVCQGVQSIIASYGGSGSIDASSSKTLTQVVSGTQTVSGEQWCNTSPIVAPNDNTGIAYPSYITVSGYPAGATVSTVSVNLNSVAGNTDIDGEFLLVAPGTGGQNLDFWDDAFNATSTSGSGVNLTIEDDAGQSPAGLNPTSGNYKPYDGEITASSYPVSLASEAVPAIPAVPGTLRYPAPYGSSSNTFASSFNNAPANGDWALYVTAGNGAGNFTVGGWCVNLSLNTGVSTATKVTSSQNPSQPSQPITYTAAVTNGGSPVTSGGTVTFLDNGDTPGGTVSGNNVVTLSAAGTATFTSSSLYDQIDLGATNGTENYTKVYEGDHTLSGNYGGTSSDNPSIGSVVERFDNPTTFTSTGTSIYSACNAGPVYSSQGNKGAFTPNPSNIFAKNLPGTISAVTLTLDNFYTNTGDVINDVESMVEGPTKAALDFFSGTGGSTPGAVTSGNYTFADSAGSEVPSGTFGPGTYKPTSYNSNDTFTSSASGFYNTPPSFVYSAPQGSGTFASTFGNTNPNGTWSLFFNMSVAQNVTGSTKGWCLNFTETSPAVSINESHSGNGINGDFTQGQTNAQIITAITNNGAGPTGDPTGSNPLTVTDTLNNALTYESFSGSGWSCTATSATTPPQTVTCTNDSAIAQGSAYPELALSVNVSSAETGTFTNSVSVSGAGITANTASDTINVDSAPILSITNPGLTDSGGFKQGGTGQWIIPVWNIAANGVTSGQVTVLDTLPTGYTLNTYSSTSNLWSCSGTNAVTCTASPGIPAGSSSTITLTVSIPANSPTSVSDVASVYGGGDLHHTSPATASQSNTDTVTVAVTPTPTTLSLSAVSASPIAYGQQVTLAAVLSPYTAQADSSNGELVTFYNGATSLGTGALNNGVATLSVSTLPVGSDSITASYPGDTYLIASSSNSVGISVSTPGFVVNTSADDATGTASNCVPNPATTGAGNCSLRDALAASAAAGAANITFDATVFASAQTITLTNGTLTIPVSTAVTGPVAGSGAALTNLVTVSGNNTASVFTVNPSVAGVSIANLVITGGAANGITPNTAGGIENQGTLTVTNSTISGNNGTEGGGIYNSGTLSVVGSTISANAAATGGGGIYNDNTGSLTVYKSTVTGNASPLGAGIYNNSGTVKAVNTTVTGNTPGTSVSQSAVSRTRRQTRANP